MEEAVTPEPMAASARAWRIVLVYAAFALAWIYLSDRALALMVADPRQLVEWSVYKGIAFVALTSALLFALTRASIAAIERRSNELKLARAQALRERNFSESVIESMPGILYFYNSQLQLLRWNRNFEKVSGYTHEEIAKMSPLDFFAPEDRAGMTERIDKVFELGEATAERSFVSKEGTRTPYFFTGRRIFHEGEKCLAGVGIDVSEQKRAQAELIKLNETLERKVQERTMELQAMLRRAETADRLKSAFLATMSHELRTPLNSIIGFTGVLQGGLAGPINEEQKLQLGMVRGSARHLLELINDVLDLSKIEAGELRIASEIFDLRSSLERVGSSLAPAARQKGLLLDCRIDKRLRTMVGDRRRVEQIALNLLNNAVKFTDKGGVTLEADLVDDAKSTLFVGMEGPVVRISVVDTGIGIEADQLAQLFLPFRQIDNGLDREYEGTGLGLAICHKLAGLMGGRIDVSSTPGAGSRFTLTMPLAPRGAS